MGTYNIAVLPGDGIGPEAIEQAVRVLQAVASRYGHTFNTTQALVGVAAIEAEGDAISEATMQLCQQSDEDCDIFGNAFAGVRITEGGNPVIQRCRINRNTYEAVWVSEKGRGTIEGCDVSGNKRGAWDIADDCHVRRARNKE